MSALELLQLLAALASAGAAGLLWATRLHRRREADEDLLQAKDAQIESLIREAAALRELTPIKIREYLIEAHAQLRSYCRMVEEGYRAARKEIEHCNAEITRSQEQGQWRGEAVDQLVFRREALIEQTRAMKPQLMELQHQCEFPEGFSLRIARVRPASIQELTQAFLALAKALPLDHADDLPGMSERVILNCKHRLDENTLFSSALFDRPGDPAEVWQRPDNGE